MEWKKNRVFSSIPCRRIELMELLGLIGELYRNTLLRGQEASLRDKPSRDYTILIYHIWRYLNIL
jgi:hypothetical protein